MVAEIYRTGEGARLGGDDLARPVRLPPGALEDEWLGRSASSLYPELWRIIERSVRNFFRHGMAVYAMALAYRGLLALFPFAIFIVAVVSWGLASLAFSSLLAVFPDQGALYGGLGTAISLLLYLYFSAAVLLFGAELNAE